MSAFELSEEMQNDRPPLRDASKDEAPTRCQHSGCMDAVVKPARGRTPKFCPKHKNAASKTGNRSETSGKVWGQATEVESVLTQYVNGAAVLTRMINVQDAKVIAKQGPRLIHELVELAKTDEVLRKPLIWLTTPGKYGPLLIAFFAVVIPIMGNHGLLPKLDLLSGGDKQNGSEDS